MRNEKMENLLEAAFEAGNHYTSSCSRTVLRIAQRDDSSYYAGRSETRSDFADRTVAFVDDESRDYASVQQEVIGILMDEID